MDTRGDPRPAATGAGVRRAGAGFLALVLGASWLLSAAPARAETEWEEAGIGLGAAVLNLVYTPAKIVYAAGGATVAGLAFLVSAGDKDVFGPILNASLRGDYVLTPRHLRGQDPVEFIGRTPRRSVATRGGGDTGRGEQSGWSAEPDDSLDEGF